MTPEDYQEILDGEDWSPEVRASLERDMARAAIRAEQLKGMSAKAKRDALTWKWQLETLRKLRLLHGLQFEMAGWAARVGAVPLWVSDLQARRFNEARGMHKRLARARTEAGKGCALQLQWLQNHAELIAAVEAYASGF